MSLLDLLVAGDVSSFNAQRGQRARVDLFAAELAEAQLVGVDLSGANVAKSDLTDADLSEAMLFRADLVGIDGANLKLVGAMAHKARLREAWLEGADLSDSDFSGADLSEATLTDAKLARGRFGGARFKEATLERVDLTDAVLTEAALTKANFEGADLSRASLGEAHGAEVNFKGARLEAINAAGARFPESSFVDAKLTGAKLTGADLSKCDLSGADLTAADLSRCNLNGAKLTGARLRGASLAEASLDGVDLAGLDLTDVDLTGLDPAALGLAGEQVKSLAAHGADVDLDAPLCPVDASVAHRGKVAAALWVNPEGEEKSSLRWALVRDGEMTASGALPLAAEGALAHAVVVGDGGFTLVVVHQRPGGVVLVRVPLSTAGAPGPAQVDPLGYEPAVAPVIRADEERLTVVGLAKRGPTLVVHEDAGEGLKLVSSQSVTTARGLMGSASGVLACKGGVVMPILGSKAGAPLRTPERFEHGKRAAVPVGDRTLVVWEEPPPAPREPGGLRWAWLVVRGNVDPVALTAGPAVDDLDAVPHGEAQAWVAWLENSASGSKVHHARLPDGKVATISLPPEFEIERVRLVVGPEGALPALAMGTADDRLIVCALDGRVIGMVGDGDEA